MDFYLLYSLGLYTLYKVSYCLNSSIKFIHKLTNKQQGLVYSEKIRKY